MNEVRTAIPGTAFRTFSIVFSKKARKEWVGRTIDVLVEGESEETPLLWQGRSQWHAPEIDGVVYLNDFGPYEELTPGRFYRCEITEAHDYDVVARVVEESELNTGRLEAVLA